MTKLKKDEIEAYRKKIVAMDTKGLDFPAIFEAPLGEWIGHLAGVACALKAMNKLPNPEPLTGKERFNAQGLEGKITVCTNICSAVVYYSQCPEYRANIYKE